MTTNPTLAPQDWQIIGNCEALIERGLGLRFDIQRLGQTMPAFAVRNNGTVYAYLNQCAHIAMEMDWQPGQFFDFDQRFIMCATHAALYEPSTGLCIGGPCVGKRLKPVALRLDNGMYYAPQRI